MTVPGWIDGLVTTTETGVCSREAERALNGQISPVWIVELTPALFDSYNSLQCHRRRDC